MSIDNAHHCASCIAAQANLQSELLDEQELWFRTGKENRSKQCRRITNKLRIWSKFQHWHLLSTNKQSELLSFMKQHKELEHSYLMLQHNIIIIFYIDVYYDIDSYILTMLRQLVAPRWFLFNHVIELIDIS